MIARHWSQIEVARRRATAIVKQGRNVLLVKERRARRYSLPGGGVERNDAHSSLATVARELGEETGLRAAEAKFLFHHRTPSTRHSVYLVEKFSGNVRLQQRELSEFIWWDGKVDLPMTYSTRAMLLRAGFIKRNLLRMLVSRILGK